MIFQMEAVRSGDLNRLKRLVPFQASVRDEDNRSLLTVAVLHLNHRIPEHMAIVEWLLNQGVLDTPDYYTETAYDYATKYRKDGFILQLYEAQRKRSQLRQCLKEEMNREDSTLNAFLVKDRLFDPHCVDEIAAFL